MKRKAWLIPFLMVILIAASAAARPAVNETPAMYRAAINVEPAKIIGLDTQFETRVSPYQVPYRDPVRDPAVGEETLIGRTWYDYQHNGSIGKMIAKDSDGGIHIVWMCGENAQLAGTRHMLYNYIDPDGALLNQPDARERIDNGTRSGYGVVALLPADQRACPFYHVLGHLQNDPTYLQCAMSVDWGPGVGAFQPYYLPNWPQISLAWPKGCFDRRNFAHVISTENAPEQNWQRIGYWRGVPNRNFDQWQWTTPPVNVDTTGCISSVTAASIQSNRVAAAWHHNRVGTDFGDWVNAMGAWQRNNDLVYLISEDGENWDWRNRQCITKIIPPRPELVDVSMALAYGDTFRPYTDVDIGFDPWENSDELYAVFATCAIFYEEPVQDDDPEPVDGVSGEHDVLWFWNSATDSITMVFNGFYFNRTNNSGAWASRCGAWRMNADR
ncbi:MAG: hypothetical protein V2A61_07685, partial [Calditrichota bacterium]